MSERTYCCDVASEQVVPLAGTAVQVDAWLLLEYPHAWKAKALQDNLLPPITMETFTRLASEFEALGLRLRVQFIKQASSDLQSIKLFFADGRDDTCRLTMTTLDDYAAIQHLRAQTLLNELQDDWTEVADELYLVCTNGQRDICCARYGRPLYYKLHAEFGDRAWQTSHLGGHRFAPNLLCLPSGYVYGFVSPEEGVQLAEKHDRGELSVEHLRGRSHYDALAQAGEIYARDRHNFTQRNALQCQPDPSNEPYQRVTYSGDISGQIHLEKREIPASPSTCEPEPKPRSGYFPLP